MTGSQVRVLFAAPYLPDRFSPPPSISDQRNRRAPTWRGILLVWPFACRACRQWRRPGDGGRNECSCGRPQHYRRAPLSANEIEPVATPRSARMFLNGVAMVVRRIAVSANVARRDASRTRQSQRRLAGARIALDVRQLALPIFYRSTCRRPPPCRAIHRLEAGRDG